MRVRYVETRMMRPSELDPHPLNFRTHPQSQLDALQASIDTVGFARPLEAYLVDGRVRLVDGHGRRELEGDSEVPVVIYDFDEDDARLYMATVDPISALAGQDDERLRSLLAEVQAPAGPLADLLDSMAPIDGSTALSGASQLTDYTYSVIVECADEAQQAELLTRFDEEGLKCRALIS